MAKVITFSRQFPAYHPKAGEPTFFVGKFLKSLWVNKTCSIGKCMEIGRSLGIPELSFIDTGRAYFETIDDKIHTIRAGKRFKLGERFSPRIWSGVPYKSKQIEIAWDMEITQLWNIEMDWLEWVWIDEKFKGALSGDLGPVISKNDGLSLRDFTDWFTLSKEFPKTSDAPNFSGQIISWAPVSDRVYLYSKEAKFSRAFSNKI